MRTYPRKNSLGMKACWAKAAVRQRASKATRIDRPRCMCSLRLRCLASNTYVDKARDKQIEGYFTQIKVLLSLFKGGYFIIHKRLAHTLGAILLQVGIATDIIIGGGGER